MFDSRNAQLESLEGRSMFSVAVVDNVLTIRGTTGHDALVIHQNLNKSVTVSLNGKTTCLAAWSFNTIDADLGKGNDLVTVNNLILPRGGSIFTGAGNDALLMNNVRVSNHFLADTGDGNDAVTLTLSTIEGGVINTGAGNDALVTVGNCYFGYGTVAMGAGCDTATLAAGTVFGYTTIDMGSGVDTFLGVRNNFVGGACLNAELKIIL